MRKIFIVTILILICQTLQGQITLSARLVDKQGDPVPFAHAVIKGTTIGSIANVNGEFAIFFDGEPADYQLKVSAIGYQTRLIPANQLPEKILLVEDVISLDQVVVVPRDYGRELIEKAVARIPINYADSTERLTGFLRELTYWKQNGKEDPIYVAETVIESQKQSYASNANTGTVTILEGRDYISDQFADLTTRIYAGSHHPHRFDAIMRREAFLSRNKGYEFEVVDTLRLDGSNLFEVQVIGSGNRPNATVWVVDSTFAIPKVSFEYSDFNFLDKGRQILEYESIYDSGPDGRWRLIRTTYHTEFKKSKGILVLNSEYITTDFRPGDSEIPFSERIHFDDYLLYKTGTYDSAFWDDYTILLGDEQIENLFAQNETQSTDHPEGNAKENTTRKLFERLRYVFTLSYSPVVRNEAILDFNNTQIILQDSFALQSMSAFLIQTRIQYALGKDYFFGINSTIPFGNLKSRRLELDISRQFNLNPKGRAFYAIPRAGVGYSLLTQSLGKLNSESFRLLGKSFDSGETEVSLAKESYQVDLALGFAWEISGQKMLFAELGYPLPLQEKPGLYFEEKSEWWFPKSAFYEAPEDVLRLPSGSSIFNESISLQLGIILGF